MHTYICICMCIYVYVYMYVYIYIYVCVCVCVCVCVYTCNAGNPGLIPGLGRSRKGMFPFTTNALIYKINQDLMFSKI